MAGTHNPPISVIMAVRNGLPHLPKTIESVREQTFRDFEFIIVDDASDDETPIVLDYYRRADSRIKVLKNPRRLERSVSRNRAIDEARGKYIAILDADDPSLPGRLSTQYEFMEANPDIALIGASAAEVDSSGEVIGIISPPATSDELRSAIGERNQFVHATVFARTDAIRSVGGYDGNLTSSEDYDLFSRVLERQACANIQEVLCIKRVDWEHELRVHKLRRKRHLQTRIRINNQTKSSAISRLRLVVPFVLWLLPGEIVVALRRAKRRLRGVSEASEELNSFLVWLSQPPSYTPESYGSSSNTEKPLREIHRS